MKTIKAGKHRIILHSDSTIRGIIEVDGMTIETSGLSRKMASEASLIFTMPPFFVNLGADSKNRNLPEPTVEKIMALVAKLAEYGIELREKHNLQRLKP